jgi:hypothetical protein
MRLFLIILGIHLSLLSYGQAQAPEKVSQRSRVQPVHYRLNKGKAQNQNRESVKKESLSTSSMDEDLNFNDQSTKFSQESKQVSQELEAVWFDAYQNKRNADLNDDGKLDSKEQQELSQFVQSSQAEIAGSFTYNYLQLRVNRNKPEAINYFSQASRINPNNTLLAPEAAWLAERNGDIASRTKAVNACRSNGTITSFQQVYAKWMIESVPEGSLIISNGEFDTYPLWEQLNAKKVTIISLAMIEDAAWLKKTLANWDSKLSYAGNSEAALFTTISLSKKPVYLSWTVRPDILTKYQSNLFPVGALCRFSAGEYDNVSELKKFYDKQRNAYIQSKQWQSDRYAVLAGNLLPGITLLQSNPKLNEAEKSDLETSKGIIERFISNASGK